MHWVWPVQAVLTGSVLGGLAAILARHASHRRRQALAVWLGPSAVAVASRWRGRRAWRTALLGAVVGLVLVGLARPQGHATLVSEGAGGAVVVLIDSSASMRATDVTPSRLALAQRWGGALAERLPAHRLGLGVFAAEARLLCPPTTDHAVFADLLNDLPADVVSSAGTQVGSAMELGRAVVRRAGGGVLVLIADGEFQDAVDAAALSPAGGPPCALLTIALGGTLPVPVPGPVPGTVVTDPRTGSPALTAAQPAALRDLARAAHGLALVGEPAEAALHEATRFCVQSLAAVPAGGTGFGRPEWFPLALIPALLLLVVRLLTAETAAAGREPSASWATVATPLLCLVLPGLAHPSRAAEAASASGLGDVTLRRAEALAGPGHDRPRQLYNLARAQHEAGALAAARQAYAEALALPGCPAVVRAYGLNNLAELALREARELTVPDPEGAYRAVRRAEASLAEARQLDPALAAVSANLHELVAVAAAVEVRRLQPFEPRRSKGASPAAAPVPAVPSAPPPTLTQAEGTTMAGRAEQRPGGQAAGDLGASDAAALERLCAEAGSAQDFLRLLARRREARPAAALLPW